MWSLTKMNIPYGIISGIIEVKSKVQLLFCEVLLRFPTILPSDKKMWSFPNQTSPQEEVVFPKGLHTTKWLIFKSYTQMYKHIHTCKCSCMKLSNYMKNF